MIRQMVALLVLCLTGGFAAFAHAGEFVPAASPAAGLSRYRVTLAPEIVDDADIVVGQLIATCRCQLEPYAEVEFTGMMIRATPPAAQMLSRDPRVARVEEVQVAAGAAPSRNERISPEADAAPWDSGAYLYDGSGNISHIGTKAYVYDRYGRLTSGGVTGGHRQTYTYDPAGNLLTTTTYSPSPGTVTRTAAVSASTNRVTTFTDGDVTTAADYDVNGRLQKFPGGEFQYDATDMIVQTTVGTTRMVHLYTATDERIATIAFNASNLEQGSDWTIRDLSGKVLRRFKKASATASWKWDEDYIYRDGQLLAAEVPWPERTRHFHLDHLGSPRLITGNGGAKVSSRDFHPFGDEITTADNEPMKFTGHERDSDKLDYMHARYYGVEWGRFVSVDPYFGIKRHLRTPQGWNRYSYVENNPINARDPDGRAIETPWDALNIGIGLVSLANNLSNRNWGGALVDTGGVVLDAAATVVPFVPGGAGASIKAARLAENARLGKMFENAVLDALGASKNTGGVSDVMSRVTTIPDLAIGSRFGVTDIKNVQNLSSSSQLRAQFSAAQTAGTAFNLIISPRTATVSRSVQDMVARTGGKIFIFDPKTNKFAEALVDGNKIVR